MNDRILVTGGTGTIGTHLLKNLHQQNLPFTALVRNPDKAASLKAKGYDVVVGDMSDLESVTKAMQGVGKVLLLSSAGPQQVEEQNNVVEAARREGVSHLVKISSMETRADSKLNLGRWHHETEEAIRNSGVPYTFLHPNGFMQNFFSYSMTIRKDGRIYSPVSNGKYSAIDARDIASTAAKVLTESGHEGKTYILTGPDAIGMRDVARAIGTAINKEVRYVPVSYDDARQNMTTSGMPGWLVDDMIELSRLYANNKASIVSRDMKTITGSRGTDVSNFADDHARRFR